MRRSTLSTAVALAAVPLIVGAGAAPALAATDGSSDVAVTNTETVQAHLDASGDLQDARVYDQLALSGHGSTEISNPVSTHGLRNLDGFSGYRVVDGNVVADVNVDGERRLRSVSDYDKELPLKVEITYTLDGKPVKPGSVVGKSGELAVHFTVTNQTAKQEQVSYADGKGGTTTSTETTVVPMIGQLVTVLPSTFTDVRSDEAGMAGDGRGGTQMTYQMTLFPPIGSPTAEFGYTAQISHGVVPAATLTSMPVSPLDYPSFKGGSASYKAGADSGVDLTSGAVQIDDSVLKLRDGAAQVLDGIIQLGDGADQLSAGLNDTAVPGAAALATGLNDKLAPGASKLAAALSGQIEPGASDLADALSGQLKPGSTKLSRALGTQLEPGAGLIADGVNDSLAPGMSTLADGLNTQIAPGASALAKGLNEQIAPGAADLADGLNTQIAPGASALADGLNKQLAPGASALAHGLNKQLAPGASALAHGLNTEAAPGAVAVAAGAKSLDDGLSTATAGAPALLAGIDQVSTGLSQVDKGLATLSGTIGGLPDSDDVKKLTAGVKALKDAFASDEALRAGVATLRAEVAGDGKTNPGAAAALTSLGSKTAQEGTSVGAQVQELKDLKQQLEGTGDTTDAVTADALTPIISSLATSGGTLQGYGGNVKGIGDAFTASIPDIDALGQGLADTQGGLTQVDAGLAKLLATVVGGVQQAIGAAGDVPASDPTKTTLRGGVHGLQAGVGQLQDGGSTLSAGLGKLAAGATQLNTGAAALSDGIKGAALGSATLSGGLADAAAGSTQVADGAASAADGSAQLADGTAAAADGSTQIADGVAAAADGSTQIADGVAAAADGSAQLAAGAAEVGDNLDTLHGGLVDASTGSAKITAGLGKASAGATKLSGGIDKAADGSVDLSSGAQDAAAGSQRLSDGLGDAADGSKKLADGLATAKEKTPGLVDGAQQLSDQGTSTLVSTGEKTAASYGAQYAVLVAGAKRAETEGMAYGAPQGATAATAYSIEIAGADGAGASSIGRLILAIVLFAGGAGIATFVRRRQV